MQGISILIPVYNYPVEVLVKTLSAQLAASGKPGEILILDDGSAPSFQTGNQQLAKIPAVIYNQHQINQGRLATRNHLASLATYDYLLFIDADSKIDHDDFLNKYFEEIYKATPLVTGGRDYPKEQPSCEFMLHWKYGRERENYLKAKPAFMSNNFLVRKDLFNRLNQSIDIPGYGHEDSWWGIQFEKMEIPLKLINNPVIHAGLSTNANFLNNSVQALSNLLLLEKHENPELLKKHIRIYRVYKKLQSSGFKNLFVRIVKSMEKRIIKNLLSCNPSLRHFDWYRLAKLFELSERNY